MIKALFSRNQVWKYNEELPKTYGHALESIIKPEKTLEHTDGVTATCYNPKFKTIITGTVDGVVSLWCAQTYRYILLTARSQLLLNCSVAVLNPFCGIWCFIIQ